MARKQWRAALRRECLHFEVLKPHSPSFRKSAEGARSSDGTGNRRLAYCRLVKMPIRDAARGVPVRQPRSRYRGFGDGATRRLDDAPRGHGRGSRPPVARRAVDGSCVSRRRAVSQLPFTLCRALATRKHGLSSVGRGDAGTASCRGWFMCRRLQAISLPITK